MGEPARGVSLLEQSLELSREIDDKPGVATSLLWLGFAHPNQEIPRKLNYLQESLSLYRVLGDTIGKIEALKQLGAIELRQGNFKRAHLWLDESLSLLEENYSVLGSSMTVSYDVGDLAFYEGNYQLAGRYYQNCLAWAERAGSTVSIGYAKVRLGFLALRLADPPIAAEYLHQALTIFQKFNHTHGIVITLDWLASLAVVENHYNKAAILFAFTARQYEQILGPRPLVEQKDVENDLALIRSQLSQAEWTNAFTRGSALTSVEAIQQESMSS
jgi:tetratricopeptide (TPR) repeat protein